VGKLVVPVKEKFDSVANQAKSKMGGQRDYALGVVE